MINAEQCFNNCINNPVRHVLGRVELYNGSTLLNTCKCGDNLKSFTIERVGEGKFYGYGICHRLNVKIIDKDAAYHLTTDNTIDIALGTGCDYIYPFPIFKVSEVRRDENTNELSITAYDALYNANNYTVSDLELVDSYTIRDFVIACAALLGVPVNIAVDGFEIFYDNGANFDGSETVREALNAVAEATQTIYYLSNNYELTFKRLSNDTAAAYDISRERYFSLDSGTNRRLTQIVATNELENSYSVALDVSGTTQYIRANPFLDMRDDIADLLTAALANVGGLTINQFDCEWRGNYLLEIGDKISLTTKEGDTVYSYLLDDTLTYDGTLSQRSRWSYTDNEGETESNPLTLGDRLKQTYALVDKANKNIELVVNDVEMNSNNIAALRLEADSIAASITNVEETTINAIENVNNEISTLTQQVAAAMTAEGVKLVIQEELANGIDSVYTSTGYSFDANGLRISKAGSEMESHLDEDGLTIYRDNTEVLTASNTGVNGINMTVRQYLIVGGSRFEDYAGRTGCFWIG